MPKKKKKARPQPSTRVQQPGSKAGRDVIGEQNNHFYAGVEGAASLAAELPAVEAGFTGRTTDLARLRAALDPAQAEGAPVVVAAGMGGVGKTQLALTAAHQALREQAFSRALFLDLRGYTTPVNAHRALQSLLVSLGVAEERIPEEEGARAGLYRATLHAQANEHGGPVLVVADNASHPDQVQPLAPGPGGHRLLVTSRERLGSLPARQVKVGTLTDEEAFQVVVADLRLADPDDERVHDLQGLTALAKACAGLPLALRIAAGQLKNAPDLQAGELARTLAHGADRIVHFTDHRKLGAVFASSTARLPIEQAELFTLLGMAPGPDISTAAAAILAGTDEAGALVQLRGLAASHLLTASQGRWSMHDLVAAYAATRVGPHLPSRFPRARRRLLDHYTHRVDDAVRHLRALPGQEVPNTFTGPEQAWAWLDTERAVLINAAHTAHRTGHAWAAISLPLNLGHYLDRRRLFSDLITLTRLALDTAQHQGKRAAQASAWNNLGGALRGVRRFTEALEAHTRARDLHRQLGNIHG
ncbi:NB-ARC domain-containing protein, partial [Nocardiopsis dassonvillei]|uniref:NB-ARC domain-containing protein n=1 Tax=Nocardiopsis dassonvillei TaxID=2014 RepID=UPI0033EDA2E6